MYKTPRSGVCGTGNTFSWAAAVVAGHTNSAVARTHTHGAVAVEDAGSCTAAAGGRSKRLAARQGVCDTTEELGGMCLQVNPPFPPSVYKTPSNFRINFLGGKVSSYTWKNAVCNWYLE